LEKEKDDLAVRLKDQKKAQEGKWIQFVSILIVKLTTKISSQFMYYI